MAPRTARFARPTGIPKPVTTYAAKVQSLSENGTPSMPTRMTTKCTMTRLHPMIHLAHVGRLESSFGVASDDDKSLPALGLGNRPSGDLALSLLNGSPNYQSTSPNSFL